MGLTASEIENAVCRGRLCRVRWGTVVGAEGGIVSVAVGAAKVAFSGVGSGCVFIMLTGESTAVESSEYLTVYRNPAKKLLINDLWIYNRNWSAESSDHFTLVHNLADLSCDGVEINAQHKRLIHSHLRRFCV